MSFATNEIDELKQCFDGLSACAEGGISFLLIPSLSLPAGCDPAVVDALLCPSQRDGYSSRLFLSTKVAHRGRGQNWNSNDVMICGRRWWAVSWKAQESRKRLSAILAAHLEAFR